MNVNTGLVETEIKNQYCTLKYNVIENVITISNNYHCFKSSKSKDNLKAWQYLQKKIIKRKAGEIFEFVKCKRILAIQGVKFKACK